MAMGLCLTGGLPWQAGYRWIGLAQIAVAAALYVATGLLIGWAGAMLEKKLRILR